REGPDALAALITQLEGFEAPAAAWEAEILPARLDNYDFTWLDDLCLAGRAVWTRLTAPATVAATNAGPIRTTPVTLLPRRNLGLWSHAVPAPAEPPPVSARAAARAATPGSARRSTRWPLRGRDQRRTVRAARSGWSVARDAPRAVVTRLDLALRCRSAESDRQHRPGCQGPRAHQQSGA